MIVTSSLVDGLLVTDGGGGWVMKCGGGSPGPPGQYPGGGGTVIPGASGLYGSWWNSETRNRRLIIIKGGYFSITDQISQFSIQSCSGYSLEEPTIYVFRRNNHNFLSKMSVLIQPHHEKTGFLHM